MTTIGCGISHIDTKHTERTENETTQKQNEESTNIHFFSKYCDDRMEANIFILRLNLIISKIK
jgi:hypothetical protein